MQKQSTPASHPQGILNKPRMLWTANDVVTLQRQLGNRTVQRMLAGQQNIQKQRARLTQAITAFRADQARTSTPRAAVQRADGLPSKAQALVYAGEAGFKFFGKSAWAKLLNALDEFEQVADDDKDTQAEVLAKIQKYMLSWLGSSNREKEKKNDSAKRKFIAQIRPTVKTLYYEAKTKQEVYDPAAVNAAQHANTNRQKIKQTLIQANLRNTVQDIQKLIDALKAAPLTLNLGPRIINFLLQSPDLKNAWQTMYAGHSPSGPLGANFDKLTGTEKREAAERYLGYDPFSEVQRENRPVYCAVNVLKNPKGAAPTYGDYHFIFKDDVKERATYTAFDTFVMRNEAPMKDLGAAETIGTHDNVEAALAYNESVLRVLASQLQAAQATKKDLALAMGKYIEAQVHGGLAATDVKALVINKTRQEAQKLLNYTGKPGVDLLKDEDKANLEAANEFCMKYGCELRYKDEAY